MPQLTKFAGRLNIATIALVLGLSSVAGATTAPEPTEPTTTVAPADTESPSPTEPVDSGPPATDAPPPEASEPPDATTTTAPPVSAPTITFDTSNSLGDLEDLPALVEPGDSFDYRFRLTCSAGGQGCADATITDTIPAGLVVDEELLEQLDVDGFRDVTWDDGGGETATFTVLVGSTCTVTESGAPAPPTAPTSPTPRSATRPAAPTVTEPSPFGVQGAGVTVTNAFEAVSPDEEVLPSVE